MVTHLEELCFWLFLVNAGQMQQDWFRSLYFKTWVAGSAVAVVYMPLVTTFTRSDPLRCEAYSFLAGSLGSLSLTLWFTPILWTFPRFLRDLQREGVDMNTVVRLTTFYELNAIRVVFRFLFCVPLLVLGIDGVRPHQHINESGFWTEILTIIAGIGCVVSSGITLVIFFPRSVESEIANKQASRENQRSQAYNTYNTTIRDTGYFEEPIDNTSTVKARAVASVASSGDIEACPEYSEDIKMTPLTPDPETAVIPAVMKFAPNRRLETGGIAEGKVTVMKLTESNLAHHDSSVGNVHPFARNFFSPIDLAQAPETQPSPNPRGLRWRA